MTLTPEQRRLRASQAAHEQWAREPDRTARTARARQGLLRRFERELGLADEAERLRQRLLAYPDDDQARQQLALIERRTEHARKAHMQRLALKSSRARAVRRGGADAVA